MIIGSWCSCLRIMIMCDMNIKVGSVSNDNQMIIMDALSLAIKDQFCAREVIL